MSSLQATSGWDKVITRPATYHNSNNNNNNNQHNVYGTVILTQSLREFTWLTRQMQKSARWLPTSGPCQYLSHRPACRLLRNHILYHHLLLLSPKADTHMSEKWTKYDIHHVFPPHGLNCSTNAMLVMHFHLSAAWCHQWNQHSADEHSAITWTWHTMASRPSVP